MNNITPSKNDLHIFNCFFEKIVAQHKIDRMRMTEKEKFFYGSVGYLASISFMQIFEVNYN